MRLTFLVLQMNILGSLQTYPIANEHEQCMSPTSPSPSLSHTPAAPTSHFASRSPTFCTMMQQGRLNNLLKHSSNHLWEKSNSCTIVGATSFTLNKILSFYSHPKHNPIPLPRPESCCSHCATVCKVAMALLPCTQVHRYSPNCEEKVSLVLYN